MRTLRYALRTLSRQPAYVCAAVTTLALGIAVNTIAFSLINSLVLRPIPVPSASRVVRLYPVDEKGRRGNLFSEADYRDYQRIGGGFDALAGYVPSEMTAGRSSLDRGAAEPRAVMGYVVSSTYFDLTAARPALGRVLQREDDRPGSRSAVLSDAFWRARFGGDPAALGSTLLLNGTPFTVVGVAAPGAAATEPLVADCWVPLAALSIVDARNVFDRDMPALLLIGRLAPSTTRAAAQRAMTVAAGSLAAAYPGRSRPAAVEIDPGTFFTIDPGLRLLIGGLMAIVGLVLFIACANAANLALARAASRRREIALRLALGAGRLRIVRELLVEAMLVGLAAGAGGLLLAGWALRLLYRIGMSLAALPWAVTLDLQPDVRVYAWTTGISIASGAALGLLPALQASSPRLSGALHGEGLFQGRLRGMTLRHALVVAQVAASLVLLFGAGLLLRALGSAQALDLGFTTRGVVYADYDPRTARYAPARAAAFNAALLDSARALPGVTAAALTSHVPLHGGVRWSGVRLVGVDGALAEPKAIVSSVSPDYFAVLRIPFVAGHGFDATTTSTPSVVVSEGLARRFWPGQPAIGKTISVPETAAPRTVVGVVHDAANGAIWREKELAVYLPVDGATDPRDLHVLVHTSGDTAALRGLLARRASALAGDMRFLPMTLDDLLRLWMLPSRIAVVAIGVLGTLALALACMGLYGVLSFAVTERSRELGIRMALGADARRVTRLIVGDAVRLVAAGVGVGTVCALPAAPLLGRLLFGVSPFDPATLIATATFLAAVALLASYTPARRAARLEPLVVLRME